MDFDRSEYEREILRDGRRFYAPILIKVEHCTECGGPIVKRIAAYKIPGLFHQGYGYGTQVQAGGWRYRYKDTSMCERCGLANIGFTCALCGMDRKPNQAAHTIEIRPGVEARLCRSCDETMPRLLIERKINELRTAGEAEGEELESDVG